MLIVDCSLAGVAGREAGVRVKMSAMFMYTRARRNSHHPVRARYTGCGNVSDKIKLPPVGDARQSIVTLSSRSSRGPRAAGCLRAAGAVRAFLSLPANCFIKMMFLLNNMQRITCTASLVDVDKYCPEFDKPPPIAISKSIADIKNYYGKQFQRCGSRDL